MAGIKLQSKVDIKIDPNAVYSLLVTRIVQGVNDTADVAFESALKDVPVRKVFRYGRKNVGSKLFAEQRIQGRQDTRRLSLEEALGESLLRRKLGLPSAFPQSRSGRRIPGSASLVQTTDFGSYRAKNRANRGNTNDLDRRTIVQVYNPKTNRLENRIGKYEKQVIPDERGRPYTYEVAVPDPIAESDLSSRGRSELKRGTLGGALKRSVRIESAVPTSRKIKARIIAGNKDVDYAKYVEFGTRRSRAQPFLRPALARAREEFIPIMKARISGTG